MSFAVLPSLAQNMANAGPKTTVSGSNQLVFLLTIIAGVLAFVIWGMGSVLIQLSRQVLQKQKEEKKIGYYFCRIGNWFFTAFTNWVCPEYDC